MSLDPVTIEPPIAQVGGNGLQRQAAERAAARTDVASAQNAKSPLEATTCAGSRLRAAKSCLCEGAQALSVAREFAPDVAFIDLNMPRVSGTELGGRLSPMGSSIRMVALTGMGQQGDLQATRPADFYAHLTAPVQVLRLAASQPDNVVPLTPHDARRTSCEQEITVFRHVSGGFVGAVPIVR